MMVPSATHRLFTQIMSIFLEQWHRSVVTLDLNWLEMNRESVNMTLPGVVVNHSVYVSEIFHN